MIYFDNNATTPVSAEVKARLPEFLEAWGNPSSIHWAGRGPKNLIREARQSLARALGISPLEIIYTSGGSESNNAIIQSVFENRFKAGRTQFITSTIEHPSVLKTFHHLESLGAEVIYLNVNLQGEIDLETYQKVLGPKTALVSIMFANNETGCVFPIKEMAAKAHEVGALFHTDAVQAFGKVLLNLKNLDVDYASISAHKFYSLKGTGAIYQKKGADWTPLIWGGAQERQRRGGTENTLGILSLGLMAQSIFKVEAEAQRLKFLRDYFEKRVVNEISEVGITHEKAERLPNTSSLVIKGVDGETLLMSLDMKGYAVSTGAACSSGNPEPSPVLLAVGLSREQAQNSMRVSLGWHNTAEQVDQFVEALKLTVHRLRLISEKSTLEEVIHV